MWGDGDGPFDALTVALALGGILFVYYLAPLVSLVLSAPPGSVVDGLADPSVRGAATVSLTSASVTAGVSVLLGLPLGYWLARTDSAASRVALAVVVLPLVLPPTVAGMTVLSVIGPGTLVGGSASAVGVPLTRSFAGVVLAQTFVASPFVVLTSKASFEGVDRSLEEASRSLGAGRWRTVRRVTLPMAAPGVVAGVTLAFARAIGEFGATVMVAYYPRTMPVEIWVSFRSLGLESAYPVAVLLLAVSVAALAVLNTVASEPW